MKKSIPPKQIVMLEWNIYWGKNWAHIFILDVIDSFHSHPKNQILTYLSTYLELGSITPIFLIRICNSQNLIGNKMSYWASNHFGRREDCWCCVVMWFLFLICKRSRYGPILFRCHSMGIIICFVRKYCGTICISLLVFLLGTYTFQRF